MAYPTTGSSAASMHSPDAGYHGVDPYETGSYPTPLQKVAESIEEYARREPWVFASWVFGIGFVLGWKLKPW